MISSHYDSLFYLIIWSLKIYIFFFYLEIKSIRKETNNDHIITKKAVIKYLKKYNHA